MGPGLGILPPAEHSHQPLICHTCAGLCSGRLPGLAAAGVPHPPLCLPHNPHKLLGHHCALSVPRLPPQVPHGRLKAGVPTVACCSGGPGHLWRSASSCSSGDSHSDKLAPTLSPACGTSNCRMKNLSTSSYGGGRQELAALHSDVWRSLHCDLCLQSCQLLIG